jgi:hypothetical protein
VSGHTLRFSVINGWELILMKKNFAKWIVFLSLWVVLSGCVPPTVPEGLEKLIVSGSIDEVVCRSPVICKDFKIYDAKQMALAHSEYGMIADRYCVAWKYQSQDTSSKKGWEEKIGYGVYTTTAFTWIYDKSSENRLERYANTLIDLKFFNCSWAD